MSKTFSGFRIRSMESRDVQAAAEIDQISFTLPWPAGAFHYEVHENPASLPFVAENLEGEIIGMIVVWLIIDEAHIATIAVRPDQRRRGVASALLKASLVEAIRRGAISSTLEVRSGNIAAQELYRRYGFEQVGLRRRYYKDNFEDAVIMTVSGLGLDYLERLENDELPDRLNQESKMRPEEILLDIAQQVAVCTRCELHRSRKKAVPGEGPSQVDILFIGEGPGFYENEQGRPFVGAAGKFLDELLSKIGMDRSKVFITNVVKCRPPGNRDPELAEIEACSAYLDRQIEVLNPKVIVTLGRFSMAKFLPNARISTIHGQTRLVNGRQVVAMYHPAAALHQQSLRPVIEADFLRLPELIAKSAAGGETPEEPQEKPKPKQLSLF